MVEKELINLGFRGNILDGINIGEKTAFKTRALCDYFIEPSDLKSLSLVIEYLKQKKEDFFILGGGYNTLIKPGGIKFILSLKKFFNRFHIQRETEKEIFLNAQSGAMLQKICWHCALKGYEGLNSLIGIPGTMGGAVYMNAGTKKGDIFSVIHEINIIDYSGKQAKYGKTSIIPGYRELKLKNNPEFIILDCTLKLEKNEATKVFEEAKTLLKQRKLSQPVKEKSCGCFFKNPETSPAGMLIDKAGLKGKKIGGAKISSVHGNFIVSETGCTASDIIELKELVEREVKNKFDIDLEPEVKIVGR